MHRTRPLPQDRAIEPAGHSSYTVSGHCDCPWRDWTHQSTGACGPSQSERLQVGRPPGAAVALCQASATGQRHRACWPFKFFSLWSWSLARSDSSKHWRVRAVSVRNPSSWAAPAAVAPYLAAATGQGHRACGPLYSQLPLSLAGSDSPKHWLVRAVPVRKTSSWAAPAAVAPCTIWYHRYLHEFIDIYGYLHIQDVDIYLRISRFYLGISISIYSMSSEISICTI